MSTEYNIDNQFNISTVVLNDDCCELVFEYLTLEDKCRLERVSEQFKKLVYLKQNKFKLIACSVRTDIDVKYVVNIDRLQCILNKCSNLKRIDSYLVLVNDRVLNVITDCCQRLIEIHFEVRDVTKEAIIRFGEQMGDKLRYIKFYGNEEEASLENQQTLLDLCPNITSINCRNFLSLNVIASNHLKKLILIHFFWSDNDIHAFGRFVDMNDNILTHLIILINIDNSIIAHLDDILRHINRMTNIEFFRLIDESDEKIQIQAQGLKDLVPVCKKLKKVSLCVTFDDLDLWQIFKHFDALKELNISYLYSLLRSGSTLIDTKTRIKPLPTLKKLLIDCESVGNYFFSDITQFGPNLEVLRVSVQSPIYKFSNQHLIALSECKPMKELSIKFSERILDNEIEYSNVDDIGLIPLIENCKQLKRIRFEFRFDSLIESIIKLLEVLSDSTKRSITFESFFLSKHMRTVLSDMFRLENLKWLKVTNHYWRPRNCELIRLKFDKSMTISVVITTESYFKERTDIWQKLSRYRDLEKLEFCVAFNDSDELMANIEPLIHLKEITFECETINKYFFDNITKLAQNVEEFELKSQSKLTNDNLKTLSQLNTLIKIKLISTEKKDHSVDDIGVIQLLDNCQKLRLIILDFEVNITSFSIDKLKEFAKHRSDQLIRFECFVSSPELQWNRLKSLPKNLIIQSKLLINL